MHCSEIGQSRRGCSSLSFALIEDGSDEKLLTVHVTIFLEDAEDYGLKPSAHREPVVEKNVDTDLLILGMVGG